MKKDKNNAMIFYIIGLLLVKPSLKLISEITGNDIGSINDIALMVGAPAMGIVFICLAIWVFKQKRYATVVASLFLSIGFFMYAYAVLIDNGWIFLIADTIFLVSGCAFYFSIIRFNKKHGINR